LHRNCQIRRISPDGKKAFCIDTINYTSIIGYVKQNAETKERFQIMLSLVLGGYQNSELYEKQTIDGLYVNVSAMIFCTAEQQHKLYCKEQPTANGLFIIAAHIETDIQNPIIHKIANYEYDIDHA
jgi:hypothetical protein